jgi:hypothetical protein
MNNVRTVMVMFPRFLLQFGIDVRRDLRDRQVADVAAVAHQQVVKAELAFVALLERDAQLDDVDRREFEVGDELRGAADRRPNPARGRRRPRSRSFRWCLV